MPELNVKTLNRDYLNIDSEDLYISYPNCMISTPKRFATINTFIYPELYDTSNRFGIVKGLYLTITQNNNQNIFNIEQGIIKADIRLIFIKENIFSVANQTILNTFPNYTNLYLNIRIVDNFVNDHNTDNYIDASFVIDTQIRSTINQNEIYLTLYNLHKNSDGSLTVNYTSSLQYRLL